MVGGDTNENVTLAGCINMLVGAGGASVGDGAGPNVEPDRPPNKTKATVTTTTIIAKIINNFLFMSFTRAYRCVRTSLFTTRLSVYATRYRFRGVRGIALRNKI